jgi:HSP20 family protein
MTNITRSDPFQELSRFDPWRDFEAVPGWARLRKFFHDLPAEPTIRIEVAEDAAAFKVKADLPGVKKEDISVQVEGNQVSIGAEVRRETEAKVGETLVHSERYYGRQFRSFALGQDIDRKKVEAKFTDGVLELVLPKAGMPTGEKIAIK